jgi:hypothetical protein
MSIKTNFKRIALVAVAALGMGVLSSVPSQAAVNTFTVTVTDGTSSFIKSDSTTAGTINVTGVAEFMDSVTVTLITKSIPSGTTPLAQMMFMDSTTPTASVVGTFRIDTLAAGVKPNAAQVAPQGDTLTVLETTSATSEIRISRLQTTGANFNFNIGVQLDSSVARVAGTYTFTVIAKAYNAGSSGQSQSVPQPDTLISKDISIVVAAPASASTTPSAVTSFVDILASAQAAGTADASDAIIRGVSTAGTTVGYLFVGNRNANNSSDVALDSITATISGAGQVCATTGFASPTVGTCGQSLKVAATGDYQFAIQGNGVGGVGTITVSSSIAGWSFTKSANFYASAAKTITATVANPKLKIGANTGAVRVTAVDAAGANWTGTAYIYASSAADALIGGSQTPVACAAYSNVNNYAECPITTLTTGTAKFKVIDAATVALATATSSEVTVTVTNEVPATVKLSFDKATYAPNERARIYITPLDAAGKEFQSFTGNLLAAGGITVNGAISYVGSTTTAESLTATSITTSASTSSTSGAKAGSMVYTVFMPSAGGAVTLTATGGDALPVSARVTLTATATVTDSGASALAAVTALSTTVASLSTTVASLKTLITTLTNLVLKIQKKVKA